jgi:6-phospho-beta-glucosidase
VVEVGARIGRDGVEPVRVDPLRPDVDALVRTVKDFELLTVQAAVEGDRDAAIRALVTNPLGPSINDAARVWDRLVELNAGLLGALG